MYSSIDAKTVTHQCSNAEVEAVRFLLYTHGYTGGQSVHTSSDSTRKMKLCPSKSLQSPPSCNCREPEIIEYQNLTSIAITRYDPKRPVKLLIHGFMQHDGTNFPKNVRQGSKKLFISSPRVNLTIKLFSIPSRQFQV